MGRRNRRRTDDLLPKERPGASGLERVETWGGRSWRVRTVSGSAPGRTYRCPGCDQELSGGVPHVVVWPDGGFAGIGGAEDRRHWHGVCWSARERRGPRPPRR